MELEGVDVNGAKGACAWLAVAGSGRRFAMPKATEGAGWVDERFAANRDQAAAALEGRVAPYHYTRPDIRRGFPLGDPRSALIEADWYCDIIGIRRAREIPMVDFEEPKGVRDDSTLPPDVNLSEWLLALCGRIEDRLGVAPFLYTFADFWRRHVGADARFARLPLVLANYGVNTGFRISDPPPPVPWTTIAVHQYTSRGSVPGVPGYADCDLFFGSEADWDRLAGAPAPAVASTVVGPPVHYPEDAMQRIPVQIATDDQGRGYADVGVDAAKVVSVVVGGDEPSDGWGPYIPAPPYPIAFGGVTRVVVPESPVKNGIVDVAVWAVD